jgi:hypothetical protein
VGISLTVDDASGEITEIYEVETDAEGDWAFDADAYYNNTEGRNFDIVPEGDRLTREQLDEGARSYFGYFGDKSVAVPWGDPCCRVEGGASTCASIVPNVTNSAQNGQNCY